MIRSLFLLLAVCGGFSPLPAQSDTEVLFTVDGQPVTVGEFRYIYTKTNGGTADFSEQSVREYLDLYERFKLKVARARAMGLDTISALQRELAGYRRQLADNYLLDRRVTDRLVEDLFERKQRDVDFSHILLKYPGNPNSADTAALYERATKIRERLTVDNFAETARSVSDDQYSREKGGRIGFVTAPFPRGLHALEAALYGAPEGKVVGPVRTGAGYHLVVKHATRPARGEMEIAHILIRKGEGVDEAAARARAAEARAALEAGKSFEAVAEQYSEDDKTKNEGGYIGFFGINRYSPVFEDAAFALTEDGQVSEVVESPVGFHILRRISRRDVQPLRDMRPLLESAIKADGRYEEAKQAMIESIKAKAGLRERQQQFATYLTGLDSSFFEPRYASLTAKDAATDPVIATIGDRELTLAQFREYLAKNTRQRVSLRRNYNPSGAARVLYDDWLDAETLAYAESRLEEDFPEFRALMREYREGILLFEATKLEVWDRAGTDTVGLKAFFEENRDKYVFGERARVTTYTLRNSSDIDVNEVIAASKDSAPDAVLDRFGRANLEAETDAYERERLPEGLEMRAGSVSEVTNDLRRGTATFHRVEELLPARPKELNEARGYVIADYQDQLERQWVAELRREYPVKVNKKVLEKLIKS